MQHWVFPLECEVAIEVEPWALAQVRNGHRILWIEPSGEVAFCGEVCAEELPEKGVQARWIMVNSAPTRATIPRAEICRILREDDAEVKTSASLGAERLAVWLESKRERRALQGELTGLERSRNMAGREIGELERAGGDAEARTDEVADPESRIDELEKRLKEIDADLASAQTLVPNLAHEEIAKLTADWPGREVIRTDGKTAAALVSRAGTGSKGFASRMLSALPFGTAAPEDRAGKSEEVPTWLVPAGTLVHVAPHHEVFEAVWPGDRVYWLGSSGDIEDIGHWGTVMDKPAAVKVTGAFYSLVSVSRLPLGEKIPGSELRKLRSLRMEPWLRPFKFGVDAAQELPPAIGRERKDLTDLSESWILPREGKFAIEVDVRTWVELAIGDPVLRVESSGGIEQAGVVVGREEIGEDSSQRIVWVDFMSLSEELPEKLVKMIEDHEGRIPDEVLEIDLAHEELKKFSRPLTVLLKPVFERARRRHPSIALPSPDKTLRRVWLVPPDPVWLELEDERLREQDLVLWQEDSGEIQGWGEVELVESHEEREEPGAARRVKVTRKALASEAISKARAEEILEPPAARQLRDPDEVADFFHLSRKTRRSFGEAFREEMDAISRLRGPGRRDSSHPIRLYPDLLEQAHRAQLSGLAFSGGGIRSATFNLGILQGLAKLDLLRSFDYLSTVSGGGYIGSWLVAWIRRKGRRRVEETLKREHARQPEGVSAEPAAGHSPIAWLRSYSNFLTPNLGMFSADTWTVGATYTRNMLLNLLVLVTFLATLLLVPRMLVHLSYDLGVWAGGWTLVAALALLGLGLWFVSRNVADLTDFLGRGHSRDADAGKRTTRQPMKTAEVRTLVVLPLFLATWLAAVWLWLAHDRFGWHVPLLGAVYDWLVGFEALSWLREQEKLRWMLAAAGLYTAAWLFFAVREFGKIGERLWRPVTYTLLLKAFPAGLGGGFLLWWFGQVLYEQTREGFAVMVVWGPPLVALVVIVTAVLHIGFMGRRFPEDHREWWSRLGAWVGIYASGWIVLFSLALYGPVALAWLGEIGMPALSGVTLGWVASTVSGIWAARQADDKGGGGSLLLKVLATVAPYVFAIGLLALLALAIQAAIAMSVGTSGLGSGGTFTALLTSQLEATWQNTNVNLFWLFLVWLVFRWASKKLSTWVDINEFSMHLFYRNRLIRAFLGASNQDDRREHPFTGFDPADDMPLQSILPAPSKGQGYDGPFPILNTTLNLVGGAELAWQQRKARSFFFTPLHYGFDTRGPGEVGDGGASGRSADAMYAIRCTSARRDDEGAKNFRDESISLGTAASVSGAAVSSGMGAYTSPPLAFLMTVFNARLGLWLGNPKHPTTWQDPGPREGLQYLIDELFGLTDEESEYVSLSDGGHFENLGIYELVRRRCQFIVVCDAEGDPKFEFKGLGEAIRKCRIDFGVEIDLDVAPLRRSAATKLSRWHCAYGDIKYPEEWAPRGTLLYIKSSLTGDEPEDLVNYAATRPGFPHESTGDQWFDESQFESYRRLGQHVAEEVFGVADYKRAKGQLEAVVSDLRQAWHPPSTAIAEAFTRHTALLVEIFERLRSQPSLRFLVPQVYSELKAWEGGRPVVEVDEGGLSRWAVRQPARHEELTRAEFREGFFLCNSVIQLMENVYTDLSLEREFDHPDNRGWMNLFQHWAWSWMFRLTWAVSASTYGSRFQRFCERRLGLSTGEVYAVEIAAFEEGKFVPGSGVEAAARDERLNSVERPLLMGFAKVLDENLEDRNLLEREARRPGRAPTRVLALELQVREPQVLLDEGVEAHGPTGSESLFHFTIGMALLRTQKKSSPDPDKPYQGLVFLRIRNHLRNLGLGRRALKHLVADHRVILPALLPEQSYLDRISPRIRRSVLEEKMFRVWNEAGRKSG